MKPWNLRPREIKNLFNPAFCGLVIARGIEGYSRETNKPMPFSLTLLLLPLCLNKSSRDHFKDANRAYFTKILQEHPEIRVGLGQRARSLFPYTMEAFGYLMQCNAIEVDEFGNISLVENMIKKSISGTQDTKDCQTVARSLGRKLGIIYDRVTVYTTLGLRP